MRLISLLLSLYLVVLTGWPCPDRPPVPAGPTTVAAAPADSHRSGKSADDDDCPPFCQCHCCARAVAASANPAGLPVLPVRAWAAAPGVGPGAGYRLQPALHAVWQPPRA